MTATRTAARGHHSSTLPGPRSPLSGCARPHLARMMTRGANDDWEINTLPEPGEFFPRLDLSRPVGFVSTKRTDLGLLLAFGFSAVCWVAFFKLMGWI